MGGKVKGGGCTLRTVLEVRIFWDSDGSVAVRERYAVRRDLSQCAAIKHRLMLWLADLGSG